MINIKNKLVLISVLLIFSATNIFSQTVGKTGTTAAKFLSIGIGARANAMGGAFTSISKDASSMYWNPAGIAGIENYQSVFTYTKLFIDLKLDYFGLVIPSGNIGTFGLSVTALNYGTFDVTTENFPEGTGETFSPTSYAVGLTFAKNITDNFAVGMTMKYINETIFNSSAKGLAFDIGTIFITPFYGIRFASAISNYGTKMQISGSDLDILYDSNPNSAGNNGKVNASIRTDKFELPLRLQIGISKDFQITEGERFTLAVDGLVPNDNRQFINVGGELALFNGVFFLRGGYKKLFLKNSQEGVTFGVGLHYDGISSFDFTLDYAFQKFKYLGNTHSFGIMLKF